MGISNEIKVLMIAFVVAKLKLAISRTPAALTIFVEKPTMKGKRASKHDVRRYT